MATEERRNEEPEKERLYKTKIIEFFGRSTLIILQNDNGPCPLLSICNVLLLKNSLNLSLDTSEVSLQKLLSLVAERLIDSNSCIENKDAGYLENQQQNIADAIDLLPRLATGIDVNIQFRRIGGFEFTRECAIFDLLDIPLYHGWIVDPQDYDTANAIGSKSYNTLMGELVALETRNTEEEHGSNSEEDCIDFAAATTATLGVPTPCLSRARSFDDSPHSISDHQKGRSWDQEEESELLKILKLSSEELPITLDIPLSTNTARNDVSVSSDESSHLKSCGSDIPADALEGHPRDEQQSHQPDLSIAHASTASSSCQNDCLSLGSSSTKTDHSFSKISAENHLDQSNFEESGEHFISTDMTENIRNDSLIHNQNEPLLFLDGDSSSTYKGHMHGSVGDQEFLQTCSRDTSIILMREDNQSGGGSADISIPSALNADSELSGGGRMHIDVAKGVPSSLDGSEPIYEGEDCILNSGLSIYENREPMYEGEIVLSEQADRGTEDACDTHPWDDITQQNGDLISNFLRNSASQLTIYGLFCLQEGLKERELCVFFRNNHFSTMFKFNGELYLLATDQGYLNQPALVWEKLNEVNGDTVFMTSNFTEFHVENDANDTWDQQNAMTSTADYLASIDHSAPVGSTLNSDLQLAIALQQQEFENQPQRHHKQQSSAGTNSRLVTAPQVPRSNASNSSLKQDTKLKDKCVVM